MGYIDFITQLHKSTPRDYLERFVKHDKAHCATVAKQFGQEYWDGDRKYGYGGYHYDGRWKPVAEKIIEHYNLTNHSKILDAGCGKGFLLYEIKRLLPEAEIAGIDVSQYALDHAKEEVKPYLQLASIKEMPFTDHYFDFIISLNTLHYLYIDGLKKAIEEIERVGKGKSYVVVESYRNEQEKANLLCWQLTCECFYTPHEWEWLFNQFAYTGDHSFIFFE